MSLLPLLCQHHFCHCFRCCHSSHSCHRCHIFFQCYFSTNSLTFFALHTLSQTIKTSFMQQSTSNRPKTYLTINWYADSEKNNPCHSRFSSLLQHYAFYGRAPLCMPSWLLVLKFFQQFTNLLVWIDSTSFNQFVLVGVWHSFFHVYIN